MREDDTEDVVCVYLAPAFFAGAFCCLSGLLGKFRSETQVEFGGNAHRPLRRGILVSAFENGEKKERYQ